MSDLVVTVPKHLWLDWLEEGDCAGEPGSILPEGDSWAFYLGGCRPPIWPGERLYVVAWGRLRGYAPVVRVTGGCGRWAILRRGGAVAVTIDETIKGFRGWRRVWWSRDQEKMFPDWKTAGVGLKGQL